MFAGHVGAALGLCRADRRLNVGTFIVAALLLDILLWIFVLLGWESVSIPIDFNKSHQANYIFPYSHGLIGSLAWSGLAALAVYFWYPRLDHARLRPAVLVGTAIFSHWILDALVHVPELPLMGSQSPKVGLGLWQSLSLALTVEGFIVAAGLWIFMRGAPLSRGKKAGLFALCVLILAFTIVGMTVAPAPPSVATMAISSLITALIVVALAFWLGNIPVKREEGKSSIGA